MPSMVKQYADFRGGWNADSAPDNLADNELMLCDNAELSERGAISKVKGTAPLNSVAYDAEVEQLIEWPRNDGTKVLLAIIGTALCKIADDGTKTDIKTLSSKEIGYFFLQDKFYFSYKESGTDKFSYYDGTTVTDVTPNAAADNDLAPIKRCRAFLWHPNSFRIFASLDPSDKTVLYYSEPNDPTYFKGTNKLYPSTGDGPVKGLDLFSRALIVEYQNTIWTTQWEGLSDATWKKMPVGQGVVAARSTALTPNSLTFLGQGGLFSISPGLLDDSFVMVAGDEMVVNRAKDKVSSIIRNIVHPETACAVYDAINERYLLAYGDDTANPKNNKILVLDWGLMSFTRRTGLQVNEFLQRSNGDLLIASGSYILKMEQGNKDFDITIGQYKAISLSIKSKQYNLDYPVHQKRVRRFFISGKQYKDATTTLDKLVITSAYKYKMFENIPFDESFLWGKNWGGVWGWSDLITKEMNCFLEGQRFMVEIEDNNIDDAVTIYGFSFEYKVKKPRGVKVR